MNCPDCQHLNHYQEAPNISYGLNYYECKHPNHPKESYANICFGKHELFKETPKWCPLKKASEK